MKVRIIRQYDEFVEVETSIGHIERIPLNHFRSIGEVEQEQADIIAQELSKKQLGIFWVEFDSHIEEEEDPRAIFLLGRPNRSRSRAKGLPDYPVFVAGYLNGKKTFPKIGQELKPSIEKG